jgi:hypothetical protein
MERAERPPTDDPPFFASLDQLGQYVGDQRWFRAIGEKLGCSPITRLTPIRKHRIDAE